MKLFERENEFDAALAQAATEAKIPLFVLKGFIALESAFNPKAYRYEPHIKDASYGLTQILTGTARGAGYQGTPDGLYDPYTAALYGGRFIRALATKYPILPDLVAAYNMGWPRPIAKTTPLIAGVYRYPIEYRNSPPPGWVYANEFYVRRTVAYIAYYQAREVGDTNRAEAIAGLLKKNEVSAVYFMSLPILAGEK